MRFLNFLVPAPTMTCSPGAYTSLAWMAKAHHRGKAITAHYGDETKGLRLRLAMMLVICRSRSSGLRP
jgi:hypothetical protein